MMRPAKSRATFNAAILTKLAEIVVAIPEPDVRQIVANHFAQQLNARLGGFNPGYWQNVTGGRLSGPNRLDGDSAGIPAELTVAPRTDLVESILRLDPKVEYLDGSVRGDVTVSLPGSDGAGRVFKWLQGQIEVARRKVHV